MGRWLIKQWVLDDVALHPLYDDDDYNILNHVHDACHTYRTDNTDRLDLHRMYTRRR